MVVQLDELIARTDLKALKQALAEMSVVEIADELERQPAGVRAVLFRLLRKDRALAVFEQLEPAYQEELLTALREGRVRHLVEEMDPDDRARLLDEVPAGVARRLLAGLSPQERQLTAELLGYPEGSAGRVMSPEWANLQPWMAVADALARVRAVGRNAETIYVLPVTDQARRLVGMVELRDIVTAPAGATVGDLMDSDPYFVSADEDQEKAARLISDADLIALPVVDGEQRLVGVITVDDALEILEQEHTEDIERSGAIQPIRRPYLSVSVVRLARSRIVWLLVLIVAAALTVNVLAYFEETLATVVALALFIPLLIDTGGNTGSQTATTVIRALAVGEVRFTDLPRVVAREFRVGVVLGVMLAALAFPPVAFFFATDIALVVSITLLTICTMATFLGALLPLLAKRVGVDPAVISAPLITTLVDATGLVIYFVIAQAILGL